MNINPELWKQDLPDFKEKQMLFTEEKFLKISTKDFQVFMVAMLKRVAKPVCSVFV